MWHHPKSLGTALHFAIHPQWLDISTCSTPTVVDHVSSDVTRILVGYPAQWVWCLSEQARCDSLSCVAFAPFSGTMWYLHATCQALEKATPLQKLRIYTHFRIQHKGRCGLWSPPQYQQLLCNSCSQAIQHADSESNLGRWAELLEYRIPHLPFQRNPLLRMIRASSHIHSWSLSTRVHSHVIYVIFHVHLFCLYIGRTECALVQRLRKHWTIARSGSEDNPFYNMLLRTGIHHWTIAPLQFTDCEIKACFLERAWWFKWRKWALNACAPAIPFATDTAAPPPQHTKRLGTMLRRLHSARIDRDFAQIHFLQKEVSAISSG